MKKILNLCICICLSLTCFFVGAQSNQIEQNKTVSIEDLTMQAEQGNPQSQFELGEIYMKGQVVPKDEALAYIWLKKSADQGLAQSQYELARMYLKGFEKTAKDTSVAASWFKKAADQGFANAQYFMGVMYGLGEGVPKDEMLSEKYMRDAAINGVPQAQVIEGKRHKAGKNTPIELIIAYAYFNLAASVESPAKSEAIILRDELNTAFSSDDKKTAQALSTQFATVGIVKALDQYNAEVKKRESEALAAKAAEEKAAQEIAAREAEKIAHEEKMALIIDWAKKIGFVILGLVILGSLVYVIRKQFNKHRNAIESFARDKVPEGAALAKDVSAKAATGLMTGASIAKDVSAKTANGLIGDIQKISKGWEEANTESSKTEGIKPMDRIKTSAGILWPTLSGRQKLVVVLPLVALLFGGSLYLKNLVQGGPKVNSENVSSIDRGNFIRIGGWICNKPYEAASNARIQEGMSRNPNMPATGIAFQGCEQVGARIPVNVISKTNFNGYELIQIGNAGGTAWIVDSDLE